MLNDNQFNDFLIVYIKKRLENVSPADIGDLMQVKFGDIEEKQKDILYFWEHMILMEREITQAYLDDIETAAKVVDMLFTCWKSRGQLEKTIQKQVLRFSFEITEKTYMRLMKDFKDGVEVSFKDILKDFDIQYERPN